MKGDSFFKEIVETENKLNNKLFDFDFLLENYKKIDFSNFKKKIEIAMRIKRTDYEIIILFEYFFRLLLFAKVRGYWDLDKNTIFFYQQKIEGYKQKREKLFGKQKAFWDKKKKEQDDFVNKLDEDEIEKMQEELLD